MPRYRSLHLFLLYIHLCVLWFCLAHPRDRRTHAHASLLWKQVYIWAGSHLFRGDHLFSIPPLQSGEAGVVLYMPLPVFSWSHHVLRQDGFLLKTAGSGSAWLGYNPSLSPGLCGFGKLVEPLCLRVLPCKLEITLSTLLVILRVRRDSDWSVNISCSSFPPLALGVLQSCFPAPTSPAPAPSHWPQLTVGSRIPVMKQL